MVFSWLLGKLDLYNYLCGIPGVTGFSSNSTAEEVADSMPCERMKDKVVMVTGCASGLGREVVRVLVEKEAHVVMACRNRKQMLEFKEELTVLNENAKLTCLELDLSDLESVRRCAQEFLSLKLPLHVLINNAGVMACPLMLSKQGYEMQFATNHLGHFLLTGLMLPVLKETAEKSGRWGRVVSVASEGHRLAINGCDFSNLDGSKGYWLLGYSAYAKSKLCNIHLASELERRMREGGHPVTAVSLHPGVIHTNLFRYGPAAYFGLIGGLVSKFVKTIPQGAATHIYCAFGDISGNKGGYWFDVNPAKPSSLGQNSDLARQLWEESEFLVKQKCG